MRQKRNYEMNKVDSRKTNSYYNHTFLKMTTNLQRYKATMLQSYNTAMLQGCKAIKLQSFKVKRLQITKPQSNKAIKL